MGESLTPKAEELGQKPEKTPVQLDVPMRSICGHRFKKPIKGRTHCINYPIAGAKYCKEHNGKRALVPPGDPRRGGRPITHGMYSKYLKNKVLADYNAAEVGTLEYDIKLAKAKLAWAVRQWQKDPDGGIPVASYAGKDGAEGSERLHLWSDIVETHQRTVLQLERGHHEITSQQAIPAALQVNLQVVNAFATLPAEAVKAYAETGELTAEAWEAIRTGEGSK